MDGNVLADRLGRGMGAGARAIGLVHDVYRPRGAAFPVRLAWRVVQLAAAFDGGDPGYRRPRHYERSQRGLFDTAYVRVGDYLAGPRGVLFVAAVPALARPLCVLTNATVDVWRPSGPAWPGLNEYGGAGPAEAVLTSWPAQVMTGGGGRPGELPGDAELAGFVVLLPVSVPVSLRGSDVVSDERGRRFVVGAAEETEMGWALRVRLVGA